MIAFPRFAILTAFLLVALLGGCGSSQNYVFNGAGDQNAPPSGRIASIRVTPASLVMAPGQTEELEVVATYVNGVRRNVSRWVSWSVSPTTLATVSPESIVTALAPGQGRLTDQFGAATGQGALLNGEVSTE